MASEPTPTLPHSPVGATDAETLIRRFEADWRAGGRPAIDACLDGLTGERRRGILVELIHAELELRLKAGEPARVEEYLGRFPELAADKVILLDLIAAEYRQRRRREKNLSAGGFQVRFPHLQTELASVLSGTMTESAAMNQPNLPPPAEAGKGDHPGTDVPGTPPPASHVQPTVAQGEDQSRVDGPAASPPDENIEEIRSRLAAPQRPDELGRLGAYRVLEVLGAGGMGAVFRAEDTSLQRPVALKVMLPALAATRSARERFLREARAAAALKHDHIVTIHQVGEDHGVPFLAMELLEGESLESRLRRENRLPLPEAVRIGRQIAEALAAAHQKGVVHRDVKPANVWLEAGSRRVKLLDFGLARSNRDAHLTQSGAILGTPGYMAPEQATGKPSDARSDLFSLGVVLYRMLTGGLPFEGHDMLSMLVTMTTTAPKPVSKANADVPWPLADLVMRLLAREPAGRPATAEEVVAALVRAEQDLQTQEAAAARRQASKRFRRAMSLAALAGAAFLAVGLAALTVIRVATDKGDLVIEADNDVEVALKQGGKQVQVLDTRTGRKFTIQAGEYDAEVTELPEGVHVQTKHFTLSRGGREVLTVRLDAPNALPMQPADAKAAPARAAAPFDAAKAKQLQRAWADNLGVPVVREADLGGGIKMKLVLIPPGTFLMGAPDGETWRDDEGRQNKDAVVPWFPADKPRHPVEITRPFYLGSYPVTRGQFAAFAKAASYTPESETTPLGGTGFDGATRKFADGLHRTYTWKNPGYEQTDAHPAVEVTWNDAVKFCAWLSRKEGKTCELPTEAEWEYACRAGTTTRYWCGDAWPSLEGNANIADASLTRRMDAGWGVAWDDGYPFTSPVGAFRPNPWGLYDMHGNVWQWCADCSGPYPEGPVKDPRNESGGGERVARGGSWYSPAFDCRSARRLRGALNVPIGDVGFRVVLRPDSAPPPATPPADRAADAERLAALPAEQQVDAVAAELKARNPGFVGNLTPTIENGVVTGLSFNADDVTDLSPLRALPELQSLTCPGGGGHRSLSDLSPLKGMKLTYLACDHTRVSDLSPLKGMKLTVLGCEDTRVSDLSPLKGMKLTTLNCGYNQVSDLEPLEGMPLVDLCCWHAPVSDLSPLRGMKLRGLQLDATPVSDLSPLRGMKLGWLSIPGTKVSDLSPLKDMPLTQLICVGTPVSDLSPLRGMPLKSLDCDFKPERDAEVLRSIPTLETINGKPAADFWKEVDGK